MKKLGYSMLVVIIVAAVASAAPVWNWSSQVVSANIPDPNASMDALVQSLHPTPLSGNGTMATDWLLRIYNTTTEDILYSSSANNLGWHDGANSFVFSGFNFPEEEGQVVKMVLYGNADGPDIPYSWIDSNPLTLPSGLSAPPAPGSTNVAFDFSGAQWQAIPEPATALMLILGGMGAWIFRRSKIKSQQEQEA